MGGTQEEPQSGRMTMHIPAPGGVLKTPTELETWLALPRNSRKDKMRSAGVFLIRCDLSVLLPFPPLAELCKAEGNDSETVHPNPDPRGVCAVWAQESEGVGCVCICSLH